ncbi:MAG: bifunctional rhamnulose-1-phosphate aldolase/short-chain dehydrogenase, partial [Trueperaceae bacterium]|nr:bifunctional rhamnulose-1-phosphate aldolase/short-chain dehydrogenase [Trueperaceae bacterium]
HAFVPKAHVDHLHPDSVIAIAAAEDSEALTREAFGGRIGYLPWKRPGFELGLMLRDLIEAHPDLDGAVMGSHGLICWADTAEACYALSLKLINQAAEFLESRSKAEPFGPIVRPARRDDAREALVALVPKLRGLAAHEGRRLIAEIDTSDATLDFLAREAMPRLAALGTSCPDHFLRTKIRPLVLGGDTDDAALEQAFEAYRAEYAAYYERCKRSNSPAIRNPNPSVILVPGLGMIAFGKNKKEAQVTCEFYQRAIEVMRGAEGVSKYTALPEQEAFDIEYWLLEEAKLKRMPPEKEFSRQVAVVTGAAQGIGRATAMRLASLGACVVALDLNEEKLKETVAEIDGAIAVRCDVTSADALRAAFEEAILQFGGVDVAVVSAGNARRGTLLDTSDEDYAFLSDLLMRAYFETARAATRIMVRQGTGGSVVFVASKNAVATGSNAAIYSAAKAFELHLMRTAANDLAKHGIRCNAVNPDAVLQGSGIWNDQWKTETAAALGIPPDGLQEYYRNRTLLHVEVSADDVAQAIVWLASEARSSRTTGAVIPVDGGIREGFLR